jgi:hypothetical protein
MLPAAFSTLVISAVMTLSRLVDAVFRQQGAALLPEKQRVLRAGGTS